MDNIFVMSRVGDCQVIELDKHSRPNGNITVVEDCITVPFDIRRVYYLYDVPGGSFDVILDDGRERRIVSLNRPYYGLLIRPGIWRELNNFSSGAVSLVLASELYDENDYIREYSDFLKEKEIPLSNV